MTTDRDSLNQQLQEITREQFAHLAGKAIKLNDAPNKYGVNRRSLDRWVKAGYIRVIKTGYGSEVDEGDVAFCVAVHKVRRQYNITSAPLLEADGKRPYLIKYPDLSARRRETGRSS